MMHYAIIEDIMQALANIPIPDLSNYPTKAELTDLLYKYATKEDLQYEQDMRAKEDQNLMELVQKVDADHINIEQHLITEIDELKSMANALNAAVNAMNTRIDYLEKEINELKGN
jgi:capsule polysaccharide export protein KpsE/RkpR